MAVVQNAYSDYPAYGFPGMVANGETSNRISRTIEDAAGVAPGVAVYRGTGDHGCTATVGTAATFLGFTIADHGLATVAGGPAADVYPQYASVGILTAGVMWVNATAAVADGAAVTIGKGGGAADAISSTAADATHIATNGFVFDDTASGAALVRIAKR
jgi:hypothetical protein